ncbi:MAG: MerR family transcriptional regulator [Candidatus Thorarchaeota archaeon]
MFSVSQAARRLGVCPKTIRRWHATGPLLKKMRHLAGVVV